MHEESRSLEQQLADLHEMLYHTIVQREACLVQRDAYRRIAHALIDLIHEGQSRGLQDATINRMTSRYDVAAMGKLETELVRLERGIE